MPRTCIWRYKSLRDDALLLIVIPAVCNTFLQMRALDTAREDFMRRLTHEAQRIAEGDSEMEESIVSYGDFAVKTLACSPEGAAGLSPTARA